MVFVVTQRNRYNGNNNMNSLNSSHQVVSGPSCNPREGFTDHSLSTALAAAQSAQTIVDEGVTISCRLQPVLSLSQRNVVGLDALPLFDFPSTEETAPVVEAARSFISSQPSLHHEALALWLVITRFAQVAPSSAWISLRISQHLLMQDDFIEQLECCLRRLIISHERIVIDVDLQEDWLDPPAQALLLNLKQRGFLLAVHGFVGQQLPLQLLVLIQPQLFRCSFAPLTQGPTGKIMHDILPSVVDLIHQTGGIVLAEGITNVTQALSCFDIGIDLVQGNLLAPPAYELPDMRSLQAQLLNLSHQLQRQWSRHRSQRQRLLNVFNHQFERTTSALARGVDFAYGCRTLLSHHRVLRCLLVDENGAILEQAAAPTFHSLDTFAQMNICRRQPIRESLLNPGTLCISNVYRHIGLNELCIMLSWTFTIPSGRRLLCCELSGEL